MVTSTSAANTVCMTVYANIIMDAVRRRVISRWSYERVSAYVVNIVQTVARVWAWCE